MSTTAYFSFVLLVILLVLTPGPNVLLMIRQGIDYPFKQAVLTIPGMLLGALTYGLLAALGLAGLILDNPAAYSVLRSLGAIYLMYLGFSRLVMMVQHHRKKHKEGGAHEEHHVPPRNGFQLFTTGYLCAVTNPKLMALYLALLPQFINPAGNLSLQLTLLVVTHVVLLALGMIFYALLANRAQIFLKRYTSLQVALSSLALIALGLTMLFLGAPYDFQ
jgi:threonine/homoserine/homoserine lactone efflux protein